MECYESERISAPCHECGAHTRMVHVVAKKLGELRGRSVAETRFYCKDCCPVHRQASLDWETAAPSTTTGEQGSLL